MTVASDQRPSSYLDYLPALFQAPSADSGQEGDDAKFLGRFLLAFEQILTGRSDVTKPGIEERLDGIVTADGKVRLAGLHCYFDPGPEVDDDMQRAPTEFLDWLAGWVALSVRDDWNAAEKRRFISQIVPLYRQRGTRLGLIAMLRAYTGLTADTAVQVKDFSDTPNYFQVQLNLGLRQGDDIRKVLERKEQIARAIIDREKPAHAVYALRISGVPTWRLGHTDRSTLGVSTLLGLPDTEGN